MRRFLSVAIQYEWWLVGLFALTAFVFALEYRFRVHITNEWHLEAGIAICELIEVHLECVECGVSSDLTTIYEAHCE